MKKIIWLILILSVLPVVLYITGIIYIVDEREFAVKTYLGKVSSVIKEDKWRVGILIPFLHSLTRYPAKIQAYDAAAEPIVTLDKKKLIVDNYFKWKIDDVVLFRNAVQDVYTANNRLQSIVHDAVKDVLGNINLEDIISGGQDSAIDLSKTIAQGKAKNIGVKIVDIRLKKVHLPDRNEMRVYERMKAERYREAAYYRSQGKEDSLRIVSETDREVRVLIANSYKQAQEIRGEAEALSAEIYALAFSRDAEFYSFWKTLETYRATMDTATTMVVSPKSELYKYLINP